MKKILLFLGLVVCGIFLLPSTKEEIIERCSKRYPYFHEVCSKLRVSKLVKMEVAKMLVAQEFIEWKNNKKEAEIFRLNGFFFPDIDVNREEPCSEALFSVGLSARSLQYSEKLLLDVLNEEGADDICPEPSSEDIVASIDRLNRRRRLSDSSVLAIEFFQEIQREKQKTKIRYPSHKNFQKKTSGSCEIM